MRLKTTCLALVASAAVCLGIAGIAAAASSPTVTATKATAITDTGAVIHATIDPNDAKTGYVFSYGPTSALGTHSPVQYLGAGTKAEAVSYTITGLQSGTTYYYDVGAESSAGTATSQSLTFKTTGVTPAQATTGGATVISSNSATLTGVVNSQDTTTAYYFVYGPTTGYGMESTPVSVTPSTIPTPVAYTVPGLAPGTTFHYALVAVNGPDNTSTGADATFETFPDPVPTPKVVQYTTPKTQSHGPFVFSTIGKVENTTATPGTLACTGTATVGFYDRRRLVYRQLAPLTPTCTFAAKTTFKALPIRGHKTEDLLVYIRFDGNGYLRPVSLKPETVKLG
jgi:hypothetical protein